MNKAKIKVKLLVTGTLHKHSGHRVESVVRIRWGTYVWCNE